MSALGDAKRRPCTFSMNWCYFKQFSSWLLPVNQQQSKAFCLLCLRCFSVSHSGLHDVKAHWKGKRHCQLQEKLVQQIGEDSLEKYDIKACSLIYCCERNKVVRREDVGDIEPVTWDRPPSVLADDTLLASEVEEEEDAMVKSSAGVQQYCLRWKYHHSNLQVMFIQLLQRESFCDVTLACEGKMLRAHKVVLSACSTYFDKIFSEHEEKDPVVILKDVKFVDIKALVEFMYKGEINVENSHLNSLLKTAEELKIKGLADASNKGLPEDDDTISYQPANHSSKNPETDRIDRDRDRHAQRPKDDEYDNMFDSSLLENSVSINDGSDIEEGSSFKDMNHHDDNEYSMEASTEHNFSTLISHLQQDSYRSSEDYGSLERERDREQRELVHAQRSLNTSGSLLSSDNPILGQFSDVVKMNDYLTTGRRQQFWEEPFTRRLMEAIKNKEIEMKTAAELMGVSYGTLYGRYRDAYGCLKHPYRTKDFWAEQGPAEILARLHKKEITLFRAAEMLNVTVTTLANYLATLRYEKLAENSFPKPDNEEDEEMDVNEVVNNNLSVSKESVTEDNIKAQLGDTWNVPTIPKSVSVKSEDSHSSGIRVSDDEY